MLSSAQLGNRPTITDFILFKNTEELINNFKLIKKKQFIEYSNDIELVFIELPKFNKTETELETVRDEWLYFIVRFDDIYG